MTSSPTSHTGLISHGTSSLSSPGVNRVISQLDISGNTSIPKFPTEVPSITMVMVNDSLTSSADSWPTGQAFDNRISTQKNHVTSVTSSGKIIAHTPTTAIGSSSLRSKGRTDSTKNAPEIPSSHTSHAVDYSPMTSSHISDAVIIMTLLDVTTETQDVHLHQSTTVQDFLTSSIQRIASEVQSSSEAKRTETRDTLDHITSTHHSSK